MGWLGSDDFPIPIPGEDLRVAANSFIRISSKIPSVFSSLFFSCPLNFSKKKSSKNATVGHCSPPQKNWRVWFLINSDTNNLKQKQSWQFCEFVKLKLFKHQAEKTNTKPGNSATLWPFSGWLSDHVTRNQRWIVTSNWLRDTRVTTWITWKVFIFKGILATPPKATPPRIRAY